MRKLFNTKVIIILVVAALITAGLTIASGVGMQTIPGRPTPSTVRTPVCGAF